MTSDDTLLHGPISQSFRIVTDLLNRQVSKHCSDADAALTLGPYSFSVITGLDCINSLTSDAPVLGFYHENVFYRVMHYWNENPLKRFGRSSRGRTQGLLKLSYGNGALRGYLHDSSAFLYAYGVIDRYLWVALSVYLIIYT